MNTDPKEEPLIPKNKKLLQKEVDFQPWLFSTLSKQSPIFLMQEAWKQELRERMELDVPEDSFISAEAGIFTTTLKLGSRCGIALGVQLWGDIVFGDHCTVNCFATVRGKITMGNGVRIASHAQIIGFNHRDESTEIPIHQQGLEIKGITLGDDVWIGGGAIVLDGVTVGAHSIVAAGAVVTRDIPPYSIAAGSPARILRDRREKKAASTQSSAEVRPKKNLEQSLVQWGAQAAEQWDAVLRYHLEETGSGPEYRNEKGAGPNIRAWCDAVEIAALFGSTPPGFSKEELIEIITSKQDPSTGLFPDPWNPPQGGPSFDDWHSHYHILAAGYALECLGTHFRHPISAIAELGERDILAMLERQPWTECAWGAGDFVDALGTAFYFNQRYFPSGQSVSTLMGWLQLHVQKGTGLWGSPRAHDGWLQPVNGFYRLTRGTYAQFEVPVPYPVQALDTILGHIAANRRFLGHEVTACNILDIVHPIWLCSLQTDHRKADREQVLREQLEQALGFWQDGQGVPFAPGQKTSLQGTEMWLSIVYIAAEALGLSHLLGYAPRGVHRLRPPVIIK